MSVRVRNGSARGFVPIYRHDLERLAAVGRDSIYARSAFLTISSVANYDPDAEMSMSALASNAGMSVRKLQDAIKVLVEAGLLRVESGQKTGSTNTWTLLGGSAHGADHGRRDVPTPSAPGADPITRAREGQEEKEEEGSALDVDDDRFHRFVEAHAEQVVAAGMRRPRRSVHGDAAGRRILAREPDARVIMAALGYGLRSRSSWMRGKAKTLVGFDQVWDEAVSGARIEAERGAGGRRGDVGYVQPSTKPTDYANDDLGAVGSRG